MLTGFAQKFINHLYGFDANPKFDESFHRNFYAIDAGKVYNSTEFYNGIPEDAKICLSSQAKSASSIGEKQFENAFDFLDWLGPDGVLKKAPGRVFLPNSVSHVNNVFCETKLIKGVPTLVGINLSKYVIYINPDKDEKVWPIVYYNNEWTPLLKDGTDMSLRDLLYYILDFGISSNYRRSEHFLKFTKNFSIVRFCMSKSTMFEAYVYLTMFITGVVIYKFSTITESIEMSNLVSNIIQFIGIPIMAMFMIYMMPCVRNNSCYQDGYSITNIKKSKATLECLEKFNDKEVYPGRKSRGISYTKGRVTPTVATTDDENVIITTRCKLLVKFCNTYMRTYLYSVETDTISWADMGHFVSILSNNTSTSITHEEWGMHVKNAVMYSKYDDPRSVLNGMYVYFLALNNGQNLKDHFVKFHTDATMNKDADSCLFYAMLIMFDADIELWGGTWYDRWVGIPCFKNFRKEIESLKIY